MKCNECKWCVLEDYGYSNYTVEGTNAECLLDMNPAFPVDMGWGLTEEIDFANVCPRFKEGAPIEVDVDHDNGHLINYAYDGEVKEMLERKLMWETLANRN
jgi:hypothetical protein